jgi:uncharacterized protein (DUF362 family)
MSTNGLVMFADLQQGIDQAVAQVFDYFGGASALLKASNDVYLKINAVDLREYCYTDPAIISAVIRYFKERGAKNIFVMENCTQGNFTRLVFQATGIFRLCRELGAKAICLDETGSVPVYLKTLETFVDFSDFVHDRLIRNREENLYISLPKLKTHSMSKVTLAIKNQFGFVHQASRIADHNWRLHQKFADIFSVIQPDFALIDGTIATNHGHYIAIKNQKECILKKDVLIGGADALAVDTVAAAFMGFDPAGVEHIALCAETGLGQGDPEKIVIVNRQLFEARKQNLTHKLLGRFPEDIDMIYGQDRCCVEGCRSNTQTLVEVIACDHGGKGGFTIIMGKGADPALINAISGRVHLAGNCAISDWAGKLIQKLGKKNVTFSPGCNNLSMSIYSLCRQMGVNPLQMIPSGVFTGMTLLASAKARGSKALIPPLL